VRLEERVDFLATLKALGVGTLPQRQKLANAIAKARRAIGAPAADGELSCIRSLPLVAMECLGSGVLVLTAKGDAFLLGERVRRLSTAHALDGPLVRLIARLARLARVTVALAAAPDGRPYAPIEPARLSEAVGMASVPLLLLARHVDATCVPGTYLLGSLDSLAAQPDPDDRATVRLGLDRRARRAVWRGGRGSAVSSEALRERLVRHCEGKDCFDVGFNDVAPLRSRRQQAASRVLLLVDGRCWDAAWGWALGSGCVLVSVGEWLPPISELEPWVHYVPAAVDLSDLDERVAWCMDHEDARTIASNCRALYDTLHAPGGASRSLVRLFAQLAADQSAEDGVPDEVLLI
jgi:hypothetical protein